jgi:hypothetical protein
LLHTTATVSLTFHCRMQGSHIGRFRVNQQSLFWRGLRTMPHVLRTPLIRTRWLTVVGRWLRARHLMLHALRHCRVRVPGKIV